MSEDFKSVLGWYAKTDPHPGQKNPSHALQLSFLEEDILPLFGSHSDPRCDVVLDFAAKAVIVTVHGKGARKLTRQVFKPGSPQKPRLNVRLTESQSKELKNLPPCATIAVNVQRIDETRFAFHIVEDGPLPRRHKHTPKADESVPRRHARVVQPEPVDEVNPVMYVITQVGDKTYELDIPADKLTELLFTFGRRS